MKIGILTFHNAYNAGAVLQAYALQEFITSLGHNVEIINYRNNEVEQRYKLFPFSQIFQKNPLKGLKVLIVHSYRKYKYGVFHKNVKKILHISPIVRSFDDEPLRNKDVIVIGSDQLWNKIITGGYDKFYWGFFSKLIGIKTILYAICMNVDNISTDDVRHIKSNIDNFDSLSVRESSLADFLHTLTTKDICVSLDPTLLVESSIWNPFSYKKVIKHSNYVLVYAILERNKVIERAEKYANDKNMHVVIMEPIADVRPFDDKFKPSSLTGFISAIAHADYVFTSSFHGLAFSVIFHKEVFVMGDAGKNDRMKSLLFNLGISERFIQEGKIPIDPIDPINYDKVESKLRLLRIKSVNYLKEALRP